MVTPGYIPPHPSPRKPSLVLPALACDAHCHVFGPASRFPYSPKSSYVPPDAPKEDLAALHTHLGFERAVIVQASCHGADNSAMIDALEGQEHLKGIAILDGSETDTDLAKMDAAGVRGVRFNFVKRLKAAQSLDTRIDILKRIAPLGWHLVVYFEAADLPDVAGFLDDCPVPVVIDHMGLCPVGEGADGPAFARLAGLMEQEKFWVKISGAERLSQSGPPYADVDPIVRGLLEIAPDRAIFGTDWPHPNMTTHSPDDGLLVDRLASVCSTDELERVVVSNPARLYWPDR